MALQLDHVGTRARHLLDAVVHRTEGASQGCGLLHGVGPLLAVGRRDVDARILAHLHLLFERAPAGDQPHYVCARRHQRTGHAAPRRIIVIVTTTATAQGKIGFAQVPHHAVDAAVAGSAQRIHQLTVRRVNGDGRRHTRRADPVVDQRAVGRVLAAEPHVAGVGLQVGLPDLIRRRHGEQVRR